MNDETLSPKQMDEAVAAAEQDTQAVLENRRRAALAEKPADPSQVKVNTPN